MTREEAWRKHYKNKELFFMSPTNGSQLNCDMDCGDCFFKDCCVVGGHKEFKNEIRKEIHNILPEELL